MVWEAETEGYEGLSCFGIQSNLYGSMRSVEKRTTHRGNLEESCSDIFSKSAAVSFVFTGNGGFEFKYSSSAGALLPERLVRWLQTDVKRE